MIYRDWKSYQNALAAYNAARDRYEIAIREWTTKRNRFDKISRRGKAVMILGLLGTAGAGYIAQINGITDRSGWAIVLGLIFGLYSLLEAKCCAYDRRHFLQTVPCPQFTAEQPTFDPLSERDPPPPKSSPPPPPRTNLTLDAALGLAREATLPQIKQAHRDRIRPSWLKRATDAAPELFFRSIRDLVEIIFFALPIWMACESIAHPKREPDKNTTSYPTATPHPLRHPAPSYEEVLRYVEAHDAATSKPQIAPKPTPSPFNAP